VNDFRPNDVGSLQDYLRVVRRRKWVILVFAVALPLLALLFTLRQPPSYRATADVLLTQQNVAALVAGAPQSSSAGAHDSLVLTQANLAAVPAVTMRALKAAGVHNRTPEDLLRHSSVTAKKDTDILVFAVKDRNPTLAARLATAYAREFTVYRKELDTAALERARRGLDAQIQQLETGRLKNPSLYADLLSKRQQLLTMEALQTGNTAVVRTADTAVQAQARPLRWAILGFGIGLILGVIAAFVVEALDTRVRSSEELTKQLDLPQLARIPAPPRVRRREPWIAMLSDPSGPQAEAIRVLRTNIEFVSLERDIRTLMITSAVSGEGKSTTAANLAIAFARVGKRVILVDLDLRSGSGIGMRTQPGLTDVALGHVDLDAALTMVGVHEEPTSAGGEADGVYRGPGVLRFLPTGPVPPIAREFIRSHALAQTLDRLRRRADLVIVDAPALLAGSDAMALSALVDALVLVFRLNVVRRPLIDELKGVLGALRAPTLGYAVTGVAARSTHHVKPQTAGGLSPDEAGEGQRVEPLKAVSRQTRPQ
jgi:Mrp family chromosome partitioning ATPase/capsular polysaccharide biosynthesis protein